MMPSRRHYHARHIFPYSEFYESYDSYKPGDEFVQIVRSVLPEDWNVIRKGVWFHAVPGNPAMAVQGWKIHISARPDNGEDILRIAAGICLEFNAPFKFALDRGILQRMTSKGWERESGSKFVTIYPSDENHFRTIIKRLGEQLKHFVGPHILSDKKYPGSNVIHYRYGGISGKKRLTVLGTKEYVLETPDGRMIQDERLPFWNPPYWVDDPFPDEESDTELSLTLNGGRYEVHSALVYSLAGGVYLATDYDTGSTVVIKEARKHIGVDEHGEDATNRLEKEFHILQKLGDFEGVPKAIDLFREWEHTFLVEEFVTGPTLGQFTTRHNPCITGNADPGNRKDFLATLLRIWRNIAAAIHEIHARNIVLGDLSVNNIIVTSIENGFVKLLDLEAAYEIGKDRPFAGFGTPGFRPKNPVMGKEDDIYSLGAIFLGMLFPSAVNIYQLDPDTGMRMLEHAGAEIGLPRPLREMIAGCLAEEAEQRPGLNEIMAMLNKRWEAEFHSNLSKTIDKQELCEKINGCVKFIEATMNFDRQDRLFPGDPMVFYTNPNSVAYGAAGVAYALAKLSGEKPKRVVDWMLKRIHEEEYTPGLYVGASGIAWVLWEMGEERHALELLKKYHRHPLVHATPDLFFGCSGYGLTCLHFYLQTKEQEWLDKSVQIGHHLLETMVKEGEVCYWRDHEGQINLGYARGNSGIALFLLYLSMVTNESEFGAAAKGAMEFELGHLVELPQGVGFPRGPVGTNGMQVISPYWFEGSTGVGTALLRFWKATGNDRYMRILRDLAKHIVIGNTSFSGLFLGLSGIGNFILDLYQFTGEPEYLHQALMIGGRMGIYEIERDGGLAFPGDQAFRISNDFGTGTAGVALFYQRLANADNNRNFNFLLDQILFQPQFV